MILLFATLLVLSACARPSGVDVNNPSPGVSSTTAIANPASTYCVQQGGTVQIVDTADGQRGNCILKNGQVCDEWDYYRDTCNPNMPAKNCPNISNPGPDFCPNGTIIPPMKDNHGCLEAPTCQSTTEPVACTMDAKACPDGTFVGRIPPNCEWASCPGPAQ